MSDHIFTDEHKESGYYLVAVALPSKALAASRRALRAHVMPGQRRVHFTKESDRRRSGLLETITQLEATATVYDATNCRGPIAGRAACLTALVTDLAETGARRLVIEMDDAAFHADRSLLYEVVRKVGVAETLEYHHLRAYEDVLLSVPDAIAWCWGKGGRWRSQVQNLVTGVRRL